MRTQKEKKNKQKRKVLIRLIFVYEKSMESTFYINKLFKNSWPKNVTGF